MIWKVVVKVFFTESGVKSMQIDGNRWKSHNKRKFNFIVLSIHGKDKRISQRITMLAIAMKMSCLFSTWKMDESLLLLACLLSSTNGITMFKRSGIINAMSLMICNSKIDLEWRPKGVLERNLLGIRILAWRVHCLQIDQHCWLSHVI